MHIFLYLNKYIKTNTIFAFIESQSLGYLFFRSLNWQDITIHMVTRDKLTEVKLRVRVRFIAVCQST